jgi:hypothetical protein
MASLRSAALPDQSRRCRAFTPQGQRKSVSSPSDDENRREPAISVGDRNPTAAGEIWRTARSANRATCPYKAGVGDSSPSTPTLDSLRWWLGIRVAPGSGCHDLIHSASTSRSHELRDAPLKHVEKKSGPIEGVMPVMRGLRARRKPRSGVSGAFGS